MDIWRGVYWSAIGDRRMEGSVLCGSCGKGSFDGKIKRCKNSRDLISRNLERADNRWPITGSSLILPPHVPFLISKLHREVVCKAVLCLKSGLSSSSPCREAARSFCGLLFLMRGSSFICVPRDVSFRGSTVQCDCGARSATSWESASCSSSSRTQTPLQMMSSAILETLCQINLLRKPRDSFFFFAFFFFLKNN